ncbi:hypothetical protein ACDW_27510 [Acidovorax sp. DW039]|nr:hypothetical protein ACDW_27510 [Acidovorax sp. DW039]
MHSVTEEQGHACGLQEHLERGKGFKRRRDTENAHGNQDKVAATTDGDKHCPRAPQKCLAENQNVLGAGADEKAQGKQKALYGSREVEHVGETDNLSS